MTTNFIVHTTEFQDVHRDYHVIMMHKQGRSYNEAGGGSRLPLLWKIFLNVFNSLVFCNIFINADTYLTIHIIYDISKHIRYLF